MATVAGAGGERMLPQRRRLPLGDLTNLSSPASVLTRLKPAGRPRPRTSPSAGSSNSSIGSSTVPHARRPPPPPPPPPPLSVASVNKGEDKPTRKLQSPSYHLKKINKISKPKVQIGAVLPVASSPPSKKTRRVYQVTREEQPHMHTEPLDQSSGESLPSQGYIDERRAYFAEVDAFELVEELVSSGSDVE